MLTLPASSTNIESILWWTNEKVVAVFTASDMLQFFREDFLNFEFEYLRSLILSKHDPLLNKKMWSKKSLQFLNPKLSPVDASEAFFHFVRKITLKTLKNAPTELFIFFRHFREQLRCQVKENEDLQKEQLDLDALLISTFFLKVMIPTWSRTQRDFLLAGKQKESDVRIIVEDLENKELALLHQNKNSMKTILSVDGKEVVFLDKIVALEFFNGMTSRIKDHLEEKAQRVLKKREKQDLAQLHAIVNNLVMVTINTLFDPQFFEELKELRESELTSRYRGKGINDVRKTFFTEVDPDFFDAGRKKKAGDPILYLIKQYEKGVYSNWYKFQEEIKEMLLPSTESPQEFYVNN